MVWPLFLALAVPGPNAAQQAAFSYQRGDAVTTLTLCKALLKRDQGRAAAEQVFAQVGLPSFSEVVLEARLAVARQGLAKFGPRPDYREMEILAVPLAAHLAAEQRQIADHSLLKGEPSPPGSLEACTEVFWQRYALQSRVEQLEREAEYFAQLAKQLPRTQFRKLDAQVAKLLTPQHVDQILASIRRVSREREEREMEARLLRLLQARRVLSGKELNTERILAAGTWRIDSVKLTAFLKAAKPKRAALTEPELAKKVQVIASDARRMAGGLTQRAETFFDMLFWWSRGRYGIGTHENGLAKHPLAYRDASLQMQVMMPNGRPRPKRPRPAEKSAGDSASGSETAETPVPAFERRHHFWWAVGRRELREATAQFGLPQVRHVARKKTCIV